MSSKIVEIKTKDGTAPCHYFEAAEKGPRPAVIIYMDAFGVRPALCDMAGALASHGYNVLLPDLYYRAGPTQSFEPASAFTEGPVRDRIMGLYKSITHKLVMEDTAHFLEFLAQQPAVGGVGGKTGCVGYCMGGGYALTAAGTFPDRIGAAASFHGARSRPINPIRPICWPPKCAARFMWGSPELIRILPPRKNSAWNRRWPPPAYGTTWKFTRASNMASPSTTRRCLIGLDRSAIGRRFWNCSGRIFNRG